MVANVPPAAARSTAMERRLRLRRQEARLRLKLLADAALLEAHHASQAPRMASMPPCGPPAQPPLRVQFAALQARLDASEQRVDELSRSLQVLVLAGDAKQMAAMGGAIGSVPSSVQADAAQQPSATATEVALPVEAVVESVGSQLAEDSRMEADELEEALLVVSQASVVAAGVERKASAVAALLSAIESRHVESLQLALTEAEAAGLEDRDICAAKRALLVALAVAEAVSLVDQDVLAAKLAVEAEQRKASARVALMTALRAAVMMGQLTGVVDSELTAANAAMARLQVQAVTAREVSVPELDLVATGQCSGCRGRGLTPFGPCHACIGRVRQGLLAGLVDTELAAAMAALARVEDLVATARAARAAAQAAAEAALAQVEGQVVVASGRGST